MVGLAGQTTNNEQKAATSIPNWIFPSGSCAPAKKLGRNELYCCSRCLAKNPHWENWRYVKMMMLQVFPGNLRSSKKNVKAWLSQEGKDRFLSIISWDGFTQILEIRRCRERPPPYTKLGVFVHMEHWGKMNPIIWLIVCGVCSILILFMLDSTTT